MTRQTPEWVGKTDDSAIPPRVKDRIFARCEEKCQECRRPLNGRERPEFDHIVSLINGGPHAEANLQTLCKPCHAEKTKTDVGLKSRVYQKRAKHLGITTKRRSIPGRKFDGTPIPAKWI